MIYGEKAVSSELEQQKKRKKEKKKKGHVMRKLAPLKVVRAGLGGTKGRDEYSALVSVPAQTGKKAGTIPAVYRYLPPSSKK